MNEIIPLLFEGEDKNVIAGRHGGNLAGKDAINAVRQPCRRVATPTGSYGDVLFAIYREGSRRPFSDRSGNRRFPEQLAGSRIERMELAIVSASTEHDAAGCGQYSTPVRTP